MNDHPVPVCSPLPAVPRQTVAPALVQAIGVRQLTAGISNLMIGMGIFVLPGYVAMSP